jgi:uncharacterized protein (TIGR02271 family)
MKTVIGLFNSMNEAEGVMADLTRLGLPPQEIGILSMQQLVAPAAGTRLGMSQLDVPGLGRVAANTPMMRLLDSPSLERSPEGMVGALVKMGVPRTDAASYVDGVRRGGTLEAVALSDDKEVQALEIMRRRTATAARRTAASEADIVIPVIEEELSIGKREFDSGGVRVATHVSARPVAKSVSVIEERINVERRVVDRPIDDVRDDTFRDRSLELKASAEEPIITKRAHVVEEIRIHKDRTERVETINDTLRHTEVELAELPGERRAAAAPRR